MFVSKSEEELESLIQAGRAIVQTLIGGEAMPIAGWEAKTKDIRVEERSAADVEARAMLVLVAPAVCRKVSGGEELLLTGAEDVELDALADRYAALGASQDTPPAEIKKKWQDSAATLIERTYYGPLTILAAELRRCGGTLTEHEVEKLLGGGSE